MALRVTLRTAAFAACSLGGRLVSAQGGDAPLMFGGPAEPKKAAVAVDPRLPRGAHIGPEVPRPPSQDEAPACSGRRPVCVHRGNGVSATATLAALDALERAYTRLVLGLALPPPLGDCGKGGSDSIDLYLLADGASELVSAHEDPELSDFDRASAYCVIGDAERATAGTLADRSAVLCVAEAITWRLDASLTPDLRRAYATHLWWTVGLPTAADAQAIDDLQAHPELAIATRDRDSLSEGRALLFEYLDARRSVAEVGVLSTGLVALGASTTPPGALEWHDEPDLFDVLRHSVDENRVRYATLLGDFAAARAFVGARDDGTHLPSVEHSGAFGSVRFDWVLPFSTLPRRVASLHPIEPNGAMYVHIPIDRPTAALTLGFQATWEPPVAFQWLLLRLDGEGKELSRLHVPYQERATSAEARIAELDGVAAILAVGTNLDGVDLAHPFDPDVTAFEPHRATVYVARLEE